MSMAKRPTQADAQAVEKIVVATLKPRCYDFCVRHYLDAEGSIQFAVEWTITFQMIQTLATALETDRINFNLGRRGYDYGPGNTPSVGEDGYIEVLWPIPAIMKKEGTK
jgi:hypothetical protein